MNISITPATAGTVGFVVPPFTDPIGFAPDPIRLASNVELMATFVEIVGSGVGTADGFTVGVPVGDALGTTVGALVGALDGTLVRDRLGTSVGDSVGEKVVHLPPFPNEPL